MLCPLFEDDFGTLMTGKFSEKSGLLPPMVAGYRQNYRFPDSCLGSGRNSRRQVTYSHQIVRRGGEGEHPAHPVLASVPSLPEIPHRLHPAEDLFHPFSQALTDGVPRMAGGAPVNGGLSAVAVLGYVGHSLRDWTNSWVS